MKAASFPALARLAVVRAVANRRWVAVGGMWLVAIALIGLFRFPETAYAEHSPWDFYLAVMNNWMTVGYLLLPGFVFLVGDLVAEDLRSRYAWLLLVRSSRLAWWAAAALAVLVAAALYQAAFALFVVVVGLALGFWPGAGVSSRIAEGASLYPPQPAGEELAGRLLGLATHQTLAFAALALLLVALTLRWRNPTLPLATVVTFEIVDWVLSQRIDFVAAFSPGRRIIEGTHVAPAGFSAPLPYSASFAYFGILLVGAVAVGAFAAWRTDC